VEACEILRIPHCIDNRLTDVGKVVSLAHRPHSVPQKQYFSASGTHFCYRLSEPQGLVKPEELGKLMKSIYIYYTPEGGCLAETCSVVCFTIKRR
jgi:hypothetical protein